MIKDKLRSELKSGLEKDRILSDEDAILISQRLVFDDFLKNGFRERLTLFWSNHFVTEYYMYNHPAYAFRYYNNIQKNVLGNFKEFVREIGLDDAMLMYLNGFENKNSKPNENYSRELYELFTLGEGNGYTQEDITETSRALIGGMMMEKKQFLEELVIGIMMM